jgi:hypothetical protein
MDIIQNSNNYNFNILLKMIDFDNLHYYINIYDKTDNNLLIWLTKKDTNKAILLINKYNNNFDTIRYNSNNKHNLIIKLIQTKNKQIINQFIDKCKNICDVNHIDINNNNILIHLIYLNSSKIIKKIINRYGIQLVIYKYNTPYFNTNKYNYADFSLMTLSCCKFIKSAKILITTFGILCNPTKNYKENWNCLIIACTNNQISIINNLIQFYGILNGIHYYNKFILNILIIHKQFLNINNIILIYGKY